MAAEVRLFLAALIGLAFAQEPDLGWMVGHWQGGTDGTVYEEHWEPALGGAMWGSFRMAKGDEIVFYELITVKPHDGVLTMRIKHFDPDLMGLEPRKKAKDLALVEHGPNRAVWHLAADDRWLVYER